MTPPVSFHLSQFDSRGNGQKPLFRGGGSKRSTAELIAREEVSSSVLRTISSFPAAYLRRLREPPKDVPLCVRTPLAPLRAAVTESSLKMAE